VTTLVPALLLGVVLGIRHATDADHVAAVTTIVARGRSIGSALRVGALWGAGHTLAILAAGSAILGTGVAMPPRLEQALELGVALMLVGLGVWNLTGGSHGEAEIRSARRPLLIGVMHGLAGSAAVALLVATTIPEPRWSFGYLLLFGLGTVGGMMAVTAAVAAPMALSGHRLDRFAGHIRLASGTLSIVVGVALAARLAAASGFLAAHPG
jgi:high-affinity nickel-transport protein